MVQRWTSETSGQACVTGLKSVWAMQVMRRQTRGTADDLFLTTWPQPRIGSTPSGFLVCRTTLRGNLVFRVLLNLSSKTLDVVAQSCSELRCNRFKLFRAVDGDQPAEQDTNPIV